MLSIRRTSRRGANYVEYLVLLALIAVAGMAAFAAFGTTVNKSTDRQGTRVGELGGGGGGDDARNWAPVP